MLSINKMYETLRNEGIGYGLPVTVVETGGSREYHSARDFVADIIQLTKFRWIVLKGPEVTTPGMGEVVRGLWSCSLNTEIEITGEKKDPGWFNSVTRWIVDYSEDPVFNYSILRATDLVRFTSYIDSDMSKLEKLLEQFGKIQAVRCVNLIKRKSDKDFELGYTEHLNLIGKFDRARMYILEERK